MLRYITTIFYGNDDDDQENYTVEEELLEDEDLELDWVVVKTTNNSEKQDLEGVELDDGEKISLETEELLIWENLLIEHPSMSVYIRYER